MIIEKIIFKNYRPYIEEEVFLSYGEKNFTIIMGENGTGKTSILNGLTWCFYGDELHITDSTDEMKPILNTKVADKLNDGEKAEVKVTIQMKKDNGKIIIFYRSMQFLKNKHEVMISPYSDANSINGTQFEIIEEIGKDMVHHKSPNTFMDSFIPKNIEEYFFFDGERLKDYFKKNSGQNIKDAVFRISQLESLNDVIDHLNKKKIEFRRDLSRLNPKANKIENQMNELEENIKDYRQNHDQSVSDLEVAEMKVEEYRQKLANSSIREIEKLQEENIRLDADLDTYDQEIENNENLRFDYLIKTYPSIMAYDSIKYSLKLLDEAEASGGIPADIRKQFVKKLMKTGRCICGSDLENDEERKKQIQIFYEQTDDISDIADDLTKESNKLSSIIDDLRVFRENQVSYGNETKRLEKLRDDTANKLEDNNAIIASSGIKKIRGYNAKKNEWKEIRENANREIIIAETRLKDAKEEYKKLENDWKKEITKGKEKEKLNNIFDFCVKAYDTAVGIRDEIMVDILKEVEEKTKEQFLKLSWKGRAYDDLKIDDNYRLTITDQYGISSKGTLSSGESELLALSFTSALNTVSGFNAPLIIDSPLMRLDKKHRKNFAENLPNFLKEKQITLLLIDEEYTDEVKSILFSKIGKEYIVVLKDANSKNESKVIPVEN